MRSESRLSFSDATLFVLFVSLFASSSWADPILPHLLSDYMVLQRGRDIHIWGWADPGERIEVSLAGKTASTVADKDREWYVNLPPMAAGGPFTLSVTGNKRILVKDVMLGEVWVASGQSNMTFELRGSEGASVEIPKADYPNIRLFMVPKRVSLTPQPDTLPAEWQRCTPDTVRDFSAVGYYFGRDLHRALGVPIGIIESAWPGTAIEEWTPPQAASKDPRLPAILDRWNHSAADAFSGNRVPFDLELDDFELLPKSTASAQPKKLADFDDGSTRNTLGGYSAYDYRSAPSTSFELISPGHDDRGFAAHLSGTIDPSDDARITTRFKLDGSPADLSNYEGIRFWIRGTGSVRLRSLQPTITDWDDYGTSLLKASSTWTPVTIWFRDLRQEGWGVVKEFTPQALTGFSIEALPSAGYPPRPSTGLYGGMISPLTPYPFHGVIWYQGESNALKAAEYGILLPDLVQSWREVSRQPDMDFLVVQLPNHGATPAQPTESAWAELREAQFLTVKHMPHTGLAVTIDVGDPNDVHPHRKLEVGQRLALWALGTTYKQPVSYSGPLYESMKVEGNGIRVRFTHVSAGLEARGTSTVQGFSVAGADHVFHWADARIDGDTVVVSSSAVAAPVAVRYAWADSPECNLFNKDGLPASPFRTDDWAGTKQE